jgi:hypothetical protein
MPQCRSAAGVLPQVHHLAKEV